MERKVKLIVSVISVVIVILGIAGYTYHQSEGFLIGPTITVYKPINGQTIFDPVIEVSGRAERVIQISLDDRPIFVDSAGEFKEKLLLAEGYNTIKLFAKDKFGKTTAKLIAVTYRATSTPEKF